MANNPFMAPQHNAPTRDLDQYVAETNRRNFVRDSDRPYFVNTRLEADGSPSRDEDGNIIRFMDRNG
ncbi:MAG: hypothetical protein V4696_10120 [Pseudomonadota bacterium]